MHATGPPGPRNGVPGGLWLTHVVVEQFHGRRRDT